MAKKIGIIGFGNMGSAISEGIKKIYNVAVFDKDDNKTADLSGISVAGSITDLIREAEVLILAVKPQDFDYLLSEIKNTVGDRLVVSIAAGITTGYIEKILQGARVIRVMPNIGARIKEAESSLCRGKYAKDQDLCFTRELFDCVGKTWVMDEGMLNAATAISGSGPAYIYYDMEINKIDPLNASENIKQEYIQRLRRAAEKLGFDSRTARELAASVTASSLNLATETGISPSELRRQITSKGGTTEAAVKILSKGGSWEEAAEAAMRRAEELSKKE